MRKGEMAKKAERLTILIILLSIVSLILLSLLPWISVAENDSVKEDLHFNVEMIEESNNEQIRDLANNLNLINISFWTLLIFGLFSFMGATIHASGKFSIIGYVMLLIGCATLILSILILDLQIVLLGDIEKIDLVSASTVFTPFNYAYILLAPSFLILIFSISYTWNMFSHSIQKFKDSKKEKKEKIKTAKKLIKKSEETEEKEPPKEEKHPAEKTPITPEADEKRANMEKWLAGEVRNIEKQDVEEKIPEPEEKEETIRLEQPPSKEEQVELEKKEPEKPIQEKEEIPSEPLEKLKKAHVFQAEKTKEKIEGPGELPVSQTFEKALSSAIQKKQTEIEDLKPLETDIKEEKPEVVSEKKPEKEPPVKKISVRCPQCKHIFTFEKEGKITKIKCPQCGKEGVAK